MKISHIHASFSIHFDSQVVDWRIYAHRADPHPDYPKHHQYHWGIKAGWFSLDCYLGFVKK